MKLTNQSKQILLNIIKQEIKSGEYVIRWLKSECRENYKLADKSKPEETQESFEELNYFRTILETDKKRVKKLAQVSKELKLDMKSDIIKSSKKHGLTRLTP